MIRLTALLMAALAFAVPPALAHDSHQAPPSPAKCAEASLACAKSASPVFGPEGKMWIIWSAAGRVHVSASQDQGRSFAPGVAVSDVAEAQDDNGEARPKLLRTSDGTLVAAWAQRVDKSYTGKMFFARSNDGGKTFSKPQAMLDGVGQRFETLAQGPDGRIWAAWLDTRNRMAAKAQGREYHDTGVAVAWSDDGGASFSGKAILADFACDCCRLAMIIDAQGRPVLAWRHVFAPNFRDHVVARLDKGKLEPLHRVSEDQWAIDACPRHGPSLTIAADQSLSIVWHTQGKARQGLFFARSTDGGQTFSEPQGFGAADRRPSNPQILAVGDTLWRAWKEFDGSVSTVVIQSSTNQGQTWTAPRIATAATDASDHPQLLAVEGRPYLSWFAKVEGYRLFGLAP